MGHHKINAFVEFPEVFFPHFLKSGCVLHLFPGDAVDVGELESLRGWLDQRKILLDDLIVLNQNRTDGTGARGGSGGGFKINDEDTRHLGFLPPSAGFV